MPERVGTYDVVISAGAEHLFPAGDDAHDPSRSCPCGPLEASDMRTEESVWLHRTTVPPL